MLRVGITGQEGFIGKHLYNSLGLFPDEFILLPFKRDYFKDLDELDRFVSSCDTIVHLASLNRHNDVDILYNTNIELTNILAASLKRTKSKAHILFSSSTQENRDNQYGASKRESRGILKQWAIHSGGIFTGMIIPNVFGPFGIPRYNSVVATFCHQLTHGEAPRIETDGDIGLIYVGELVMKIIEQIRLRENNYELIINHTNKIKVSALLGLLSGFKKEYQDSGVIPALNNPFEMNLFNSFRSYMPIEEYFPVKFTPHVDDRGAFVELIRLNVGGQVSFSTTKPGVTRGNHFHTRKIERFAVVKGKALIQLRRIGSSEVLDFWLSGDQPAYVDMPIWYTHNIKNVGEEELYTIFWINEFYNPKDPDTFFEVV